MGKLLDFEPSKEDIIKYIYSQINKEKDKNYLTLKNTLSDIYSEKDKEVLEEEYEVYKYKKIALESTNPENLTIGAVSILAILATLLSVFTSTFYRVELEPNAALSILLIMGYFILTTLVYMFLLSYRIKNKSRKMVYYNIMEEAIKKELDKALEEKEKGLGI